jgi:hypothetical protein
MEVQNCLCVNASPVADTTTGLALVLGELQAYRVDVDPVYLYRVGDLVVIEWYVALAGEPEDLVSSPASARHKSIMPMLRC